MPEITFTEAIGGPVPAVEIEINLTGGTGLASGEQIRSIIVVAEKIGVGTQPADTVSATAYGSADDAIAAFGSTSPGAIMCAAAFDYNNKQRGSGRPKCEIWGACIDEDAGSVAAEQDLTIAGVSSAAGVLIQRIGGHIFRTAIGNSMAVADQATAIRDTFNDAPEHMRPPLLATAALGVVTYTASVKGAHMNNIALETVSFGSVLTTTYTWENTTMGGAAPGTPGIGALAAGDFTAVIAALTSFADAGQYVIPWTESGLEGAANIVFDTTVPPIFRDHVISQADASNMIPASLRMAWKATPAFQVAAIAALDTSDCERVSLACAPYSDAGQSGTWEGEIAARYAAMRATQRHVGRSFDGLRFPDVATSAAGDNFTRGELKTIIEGGGSPLWVPPFQSTVEISRDVSCRQDFGVLDTMAMDVLDYIRNDFASAILSQPRQSIVADDQEVPLLEWVTQPGIVKTFLRSRADMLASAGYMTNVASNWENVAVNLVGSTLQLAIPVSLIPALHNYMVRLDATVPAGA